MISIWYCMKKPFYNRIIIDDSELRAKESWSLNDSENYLLFDLRPSITVVNIWIHAVAR